MENLTRLDNLLDMDPLLLMEHLRKEVDLRFPDGIDTETGKMEAVQMLNKAAAYVCYFKEMETLARITKRDRKRQGCGKEEFDRILGVEEVMEAYKRIAEMNYDAITRMLYTKKLMLEETRMLGKTV